MRGRVRKLCVFVTLLGASACDWTDRLGPPEETTQPATTPPLDTPRPATTLPPDTPEPPAAAAPPPIAATPRAARVVGGPAVVEGKLPAGRTSEIIARHHNELRFCQAAKASAPDVVDAKLRLTVSADGRVSTAALEASSTEDEALSECLIEAARRWSLPATPGGEGSVVTYPFRLERSGDATEK